MSWDRVFEDLQAQFRAASRQEEAAQVPELAEAEAAVVGVADRIRARSGQDLTVRLREGSVRSGRVEEATRSWLRLADGVRQSVIPLQALVAAWPLGGAAPEPGLVEARLTLGHALRGLARQRVPVLLRTDAGSHRGVIVRVGADHVDLREPAGVLTVVHAGLVSIDSA